MEEVGLLKKLKNHFNNKNEIEVLINKENVVEGVFVEYKNPEQYQKRLNEIESIKSSIRFLIDKLYVASVDLNFYYFDCPSKVYINHFENRKSSYFEKNIDADEKDFLFHEVEYLSNGYNNRYLDLGFLECHPYNEYIEYEEKYKISIRRKFEFLNEKLKEFNYTIFIREDTDIFNDYGSQISYGSEGVISEIIEEQEKSYNNNNSKKSQLTANQIILLLQEIGFFNHPKIEDASKVKQAELVSKITGIHHKTIKNNIEKLDKSLTENGKKYQTDIDKINKMLDDLT